MTAERREIEHKVYGWGGWKMPILHLNDPEYCEYGCPSGFAPGSATPAEPPPEGARSLLGRPCERPCGTRARNGIPWAVAVQKAELALTLGGCPWGRARHRKYGVGPDQPIAKQAH